MWQLWGCQRFKSRASQVALTKAAITVTILSLYCQRAKQCEDGPLKLATRFDVIQLV